MDETGLTVVTLNRVDEETVEILVHDVSDVREGIVVAHSYLIPLASETFGPRLKDLLDDLDGIGEDIHYRYRNLKKGS